MPVKPLFCRPPRICSPIATAMLAILIGACATPPEPESQPTAIASRVAASAATRTGFDRYRVEDRLGRAITFHVSPTDPAVSLPLVLYVQGSGCEPLFPRDEKGRVLGGLQNVILEQHRTSVVVMAVEKPGAAAPTANPGKGTDCSPEFHREHTVDRWAEALEAALRAAATLPGVDARRVLVIGHSEGGDMAAHVSARCSDLVTHAACLAGAGITQLYEMAWMAWNEGPPGEPTENRLARVRDIYDTWSTIQADPQSATRFAWGHPHRRWSSFAGNPPAASLERAGEAGVALFIAHGTADQAAPFSSFEAAVAQLAVAGLAVEVVRVADAGHSFRRPDDPGHEGIDGIFATALQWFTSAGS